MSAAVSITEEGRAAITGIGCRLPGGVHSPEQLWDALLNGQDLTGPIPPARWERMVGLLAEEQVPEHPWTAGMLDEVDAFDHGFFGIAAREAARMDPQQRLALEVAVEALADAGIPLTSLTGSRTGVWAGVAAPDQAALALTPGRSARMADLAGLTASMLANRLSYHLDLRGPSITVDTACSAAGTALHLARRALEAGEVDTALVVGTNLLQHPAITAGFADAGVLAPDGVCRPFDADGRGYVRAEGVVVLVLHRLIDAQAHRDRAYALIRGSAVNADGRSPAGLYAPSTKAQRDLLCAAYADAELDPARVDYVHTHGTGTPAGDTAEARALAQVTAAARADRLPVGSSKSVFGHTEGASALVSAAVTALAIHHGVLPPTANHARLRPALHRLPLRVPTTPEPWPATGRPRTAGVSAFGLGGSNIHLVLQQAPDPAGEPGGVPHTAARTTTADHRADKTNRWKEASHPAEETSRQGRQDGIGARIIPVSAPTEDLLRDTAAAWAPVAARSREWGALASTAQHRRDHHRVRAAVVASSAEQAADTLRALAEHRTHPALTGPTTTPEKPGRLVWLFAGHGSQHPNMAATSYQALPVFRKAFDEARDALAVHLDQRPWMPGEPITDFATAQHAVWLVQVAQAATWRHWGYAPDAVIGHSLGEVAAAHACGALALADAARLVAARSALLAELEPFGGLLATGLTCTQAEEAIALHRHTGTLVVAARNAPEATVISGPTRPLEELRETLHAQGVFARRVAHDVPAHSPAVLPLLPRFAEALHGLTPRDGAAVFYSTADACPLDGSLLDAAYWTRQMRAPVRFADTLPLAVGTGNAAVVELGGRTVLAGPARAALARPAASADPDRMVTVIAAGDGGRDDHAALLDQLAALHTNGRTPTRWPEPHSTPVRLPVFWKHASAAQTANAAPPTLAEVLTASTAQRAIPVVAALLSDTLAIPVENIDPEAALVDLGLTSVTVIGLRDALRAAHPALARLPVRALLAETTTVAGLTQVLTALAAPAHKEEKEEDKPR